MYIAIATPSVNRNVNVEAPILPQNGVAFNFVDEFKHLFSLPAMLVRRERGLSAAKTSSRGRPYQFHPGQLSLAWLVFVSLFLSFSVFLDAFKVGACCFLMPSKRHV